MTLAAGSKLGPYEILAPLGAGGMGEVYQAYDSRLDRKVAIKVLREHLSSEEHRTRFLREAKAASALNNPHIVTVYDILTQDHSDVIVMEFIEGDSLRKILSRGRIDIKRALEITAEAASALAAAHKAGIIHRDIKPENVIITKANSVKLLDFGLAKLIKNNGAEHQSEIPTSSALETGSGVILGTVSYMSPEQAEGREVDSRTDIFSLGVVLYEMLTGNRPFRGNSTIDTLHAIVHVDPLATPDLNALFPVEVRETLARAIAKNPEERFQHAGDFALDLRKLRRAMETNSLPSLATRATPKPVFPKFLLAAATTAVLILSFLLWRAGHQTPQASSRVYENVSLTPLTVDPGYESSPTFSPDGETIAYVSDRTGNFEIFLKQISGGPDINLTNNSADDVQPAFSPDGKQIAFVSTRSSKSDLHYPGPDSPLVGGDIWIMPALGGSAKRIVPEANFPSWSPDGSHILYSAGPWFGQKIYSIPASGGTPTEISVSFPSPARIEYPVYSPSGKWILFTASTNIFLVPATGGPTSNILKGTCPAWRGSDKIVYSNAEAGKNFCLWEASFSDQEGKVLASRPLTIGHGRDLEASPSKDGSRIAFASVDHSANLEVMPFDADGKGMLGEPHPVTKGNDIILFSNFSPDGRTVAFASQRGSSSHIWRIGPDSEEVQLTSDPKALDSYPRYSPDGSKVAFTRNNELWIMAADGANPQPVSSIKLPGTFGFFTWVPDGHAILFQSASDRKLYSLNLASRTTRVLLAENGIMPVTSVSPDGKWILYQTTIHGNVDVRAIPIEGGAARFVVSTPHQDYHPFISPSGGWLYFEYDHKNLYRVPGPAQNWAPEEPEKVTNFPESGLYIEDPQISPDGKQLLYSRVKATGDLWIMDLGK